MRLRLHHEPVDDVGLDLKLGDVITNEGQTEINAMQARLAYAAHQDDFDYDAFFRGRAYLGRVLRTPEFELQCILGADSHPSGYLDINGPNQMFEEFYRTYDVQEGDGMYLPSLAFSTTNL